MENNILQLIKIITILYYEDLATDENHNVIDIVRLALENIKVDNKSSSGLGTEDGAIEALRYTAEWMVCNQDGGYSIDNIKQRLAINLQGSNSYIEIMEKGLDADITAESARQRVNELVSELRFDERRTKLRRLIARANAEINFSGDYIDNHKFVGELTAELEALHVSTSKELSGFAGRVDFSHLDDIETALDKGTTTLKPEGILDTGLQGLNAALGVGGIPRGAMINFAGLTHCYKSGILIDLAMNIPVYNKPSMWDDAKRPLILRVSFENTVEQDILLMYRKLYEIKHQKKIAPADVDLKVAAQTLQEHFTSQGYHYVLEGYDPNGFDVYDLFETMNRLQDQGYEIHLLSCDYLPLIAPNTVGDRMDSKIQKTYEMVRNYTYPKGITVATGAQLSTTAQEIAKEKSPGFVRTVSTGGYYMECKSLHTKLDMEVVMNIHHHIDGNKYLLFHRGKNRYCNDTPMTKQGFCYKFEEFGGIVPDSGGEDKSLPKMPAVMDPMEIQQSW